MYVMLKYFQFLQDQTDNIFAHLISHYIDYTTDSSIYGPYT